jgi:hypothetical protein
MIIFIVLFTLLFALVSISSILAAGADADAFVILPE